MNYLKQFNKLIMRTGLFVAIAIGIYYKSWIAGLIYFGITFLISAIIGRFLYKRSTEKLVDNFKKEKSNEFFIQGQQALSNNDFSKAFRFFYLARNDKKYDTPRLYQIMTECLLNNKDYKLVDKILSEGISRHPNDSHLYYSRAMNRGTLNNLDGKFEDLNTALKINNTNSNYKPKSCNSILLI